MNKPWLRRLGLGLIALLAVLYLWPTPRASFADLADRVEPAQRQAFLDFRAAHPPRTLEVDGQSWEYIVMGAGPETVLFLPGTTGSADIWWQQMTALAPDFRVISVTYPAADGLEGLSRGVLAILDAEGVTRAHVVGSSLGGYLAQYLLRTHPDRVERLVLGNTFPPNDVLRAKNEGLIRLLPWLPEWLVMHFLRQSIETNLYPASGYSEFLRAYLLEQVSGRLSKAQVIARARADIEAFEPPDPAALGVPVLIIEADNDPLVEPALRAQLKATYPTATVHTLHGVGHFPYFSAADQYTPLLQAFLRQP